RLGCRFAELSSRYFLHDDNSLQSHLFQPGLGRLLLNSLSFSSASVTAQVAVIRAYRPRFVKGTASALHQFAIFLKQNQISDLEGFEAAFSTGEVLHPYRRKQIEAAFHCRVYDSYGHMERTVAISECPDGSLHINPDYGVLETADHRSENSPAMT